MKHLFKASLLFFVLLLMLISPAPIIEAVHQGLRIWVEKVVPALFPFFVLTRLMIYFQLPQLIGHFLSPIFTHLLHISPITFFIILMSLISGNPSGAKLTRDYYNQQLISEKECEGLIYFCNFASPLFIIGTLGVVLFHSQSIGYFMLCAHLIGSLTVFLCCYRYFKSDTIQTVQLTFPTMPLAEILIDCIENSIQTLLRVGGILVFYYILTSLFTTIQIIPLLDSQLVPLFNFQIPSFEPLVSGALEFVQGVIKLSSLTMDLPLQLSLIAFCISFAGFSVHTQVFMFTSGLNISYLKYFAYRVLHGVSSFCFVFFTYNLIFDSTEPTDIVTGGFTYINYDLIRLSLLIIFVYFYLVTSRFIKKDYARA